MVPAVLCNRWRGYALALVAVSGIAQAVLATFAALATRDIFAALGTQSSLPLSAVSLVLVTGLAIAVLRPFERAVGEFAGQHYAGELRQRLFRHLSRVSVSDLASRRNGSLAVRFVGDLSAIRSWVSLGIARIVSSVFVIPGAVFALALLNSALAAITAGLIFVAIVGMALLQTRLEPVHRTLRSRRARIAADMSERVSVAPELRLQGRMSRETRRLERHTHRLRHAAVRRSITAGLVRATPELCLALAGAVFLASAFFLELRGAEVAASMAMLGILATPLAQLGSIADRYRGWRIAREKCQGLFELAPIETTAPATTGKETTGLVLQNVSVAPVRNFSARARSGEHVVIIGENGSGKSTLLSAIAGLETPATGTIELDGQPVRRRDVCYVGTRSPLLRGSLRKAFTMGLSRRPADRQIISCALEYGLGNLLDRLGDLDGTIAEAGKNLSSGEVRRVHLVRAALAKPRLLLLDEPDDALDPHGTRLVEKLVRESAATCLCVTHNPAVAESADTIWYLSAGKLVDVGTPARVFSRPECTPYCSSATAG